MGWDIEMLTAWCDAAAIASGSVVAIDYLGLIASRCIHTDSGRLRVLHPVDLSRVP